jgi:hypothetical protein
MASECLRLRSLKTKVAYLPIIMSTPMQVLCVVLGLCVLVPLSGLTLCLEFWMLVRMVMG